MSIMPMAAGGSPWVDRFTGLVVREVIVERASIRAVTLQDLNSRHVLAASSEIDRAMKGFYMPSDQEIDYLLEIVGTASQYSSATYGSEAQFLRGLHARTLPQCPILPQCLSALAGVGKSALFLAVERVMPAEERIALPLAIAHELPMRSYQRIVVDAASTMRELLDPMLPSDLRIHQDEGHGSLQAARKRSRATTGDLHLVASRCCFSMGVASLMLDETQFASHSAAAGARAVSWVLTFGRLPPPFLFAVNYDLLKKLWDRPDYDKDRILADPRILMPEAPRSVGMSKYLRECQVVLAEVLGFKLEEEPDLIFSLTANVRRKVARLLVLAYEAMRAAKAKTMMPEHLRAAYGSLKYSGMRSDVVGILTQSLQGAPVAGKGGLWCPIATEYNILTPTANKIASASSAGDFSNFFLTQGLPKSNRRTDKPPGNPTPAQDEQPGAPPKGRVIGFPGKKGIDKDTLLKNTMVSRGKEPEA